MLSAPAIPTALAVLAALLVGGGAGALSIAHCAAMCGPLSLFACSGGGEGEPTRGRALLWLGGRTVAYAILGAIVGGASGLLAHLVVRGVGADRLTGALEVVVSITLGLSLLLSGVAFLRRPSELAPLGKKKRPLGVVARAMQGALRLPSAPFFLGALSGLLPCGALWAALASASATGTAITGAIAMIAFSLASAPGLVFSGFLAGLRFDATGRRLVGAALLLGAAVLLLRPLTLALTDGDAASCHDETLAPEHAP